MLPLNRQNHPPRGGPSMPIRRVKAGQRKQFAILSRSLWGVWTHWNGKQSEPCYQEKKQCGGCKRGLPKRWKGYLHAYDFMDKEECFLELTPLACDQLLAQAGDKEPLRGNRVLVERGAGNKARLTVTMLTPVQSVSSLPAEKDPQSALQKLWGVDDTVAYPQQPPSLPMDEAM